MALNFGIRGLNPRLATRSTLLMDGIPIPYAPYGQPQLSLGPISMGNMDAVDGVRGAGGGAAVSGTVLKKRVRFRLGKANRGIGSARVSPALPLE